MSPHVRLLRRLARAPLEVRTKIWSELSPSDVRAFTYAWDWQAHDNQQEPPGDWRVWLLLAGRDFGKTRTGAEWVLEQARSMPEGRIALIGATAEEAAKVMVEGESGILRCAPPDEKLKWSVTRHELRFPSGAIAQAFSGAHGESLRGPQHHLAWADELGKWRCRGERPDGWARKVVAAADSWGAERVVAEANNGGDMVLSVLKGAAPMLAVKKVHATRGKAARAEPVAALFESGRCWLAGFFPELEDELTGFTPGGYTGRGSPDRADAMVWALTELMLGGGKPMVRGL
jgi:phage terminase large subunit-like protein